MSVGTGRCSLWIHVARGGRSGALAAIVGLVALTAPAAAHWSAPVAAFPEPARIHSLVPHLVVSSGGSGYLAIDTQRVGGPRVFGPVRGRAVNADGSLGPVQTIAGAVEQAHQLGLGITAAGVVTAAYTAGNGARARVLIRSAAPGGGFGPPRRITRPGVRSALSKLIVAPDGFTVLLLQAGTGRAERYALYAGDPGTALRRVATLPPRARTPTIAMAADHDALLTWLIPRGRHRLTIQAAGWQPGAALDVHAIGRVGTLYGLYARPGIVAGGGAIVAWLSSSPGGRARLALVTRPRAKAAFTPARVITPAGRHDIGELRVDPGGPRILISTDEGQGSLYRTVLRTWSPAAGLSGAQTLSGPEHSAFAPAAAGTASRTAVAWEQDTITATSGPVGGAFAPPTALSSPALTVQTLSGPEIAMDGRGDALVTWVDYGPDPATGGQVELAREAG